MKIAFCSSEIFPFAKTGGLADVSGALPNALSLTMDSVIVFMPKYKNVEIYGYDFERVSEFAVKSRLSKNVEIYFIENDIYFDRDHLYTDGNHDYKDNLDRFNFFCLKVLECIKLIDFKPAIIHCNDWQTALIPVYLKKIYGNDDFFSNTKSVFTIHNIAFQGIFDISEFRKLTNNNALNFSDFEFWGRMNLLKAGIISCDEVTTVSEKYAQEIQTKEYGCGLEDVLRARREKVLGITNGLDYEIWNPTSDQFICVNFSKLTYKENKAKNKVCVQKLSNLPVDSDTAIFGFVGRLSHQKGIDIIIDSLDELLSKNVQVIMQGLGEKKYVDQLKKFEQKYPLKFKLFCEFSERIAHEIYAGSDFFLMPSIFEPCGLSQMISLKYGTVPIVYNTGGLSDTIVNFDKPKGNGFIFFEFKRNVFIVILNKALEVFVDKQKMDELIINGFNENFCWKNAAKKYHKLYLSLFGKKEV